MTPHVPGILTAAQVDETVESIAVWQQQNGMILWYPGGHADPWNHIEAAMALLIGGRRSEAEKAYQWLVDTQLDDGSWHQYSFVDRVKDRKRDANTVAYLAAGAWHHYLITKDAGYLEELWPVIEKAIDWVLDLQTPRGEIIWARHDDGTPWSFALLTGSSSVLHSIRCAIAIAEHLGHERPDWELSAARLAHCIAHVPDAFTPKDRWAMDWYYPVLGSALTGDAGARRLDDKWDTFLHGDKGIRCVSDRPWVTTAETCECAMAHLAVGRRDRALELFEMAQTLRAEHGFYWTGIVYPEEKHYPGGQHSTYSAASVVLAADALAEATPAHGLFTQHHTLPELLDLENLDDSVVHAADARRAEASRRS